MTNLGSGTPDTRKNNFDLSSVCGDRVFTHLRLNIFPDGGIARFRMYGIPTKKIQPIKGDCIEFSNAHFAHPGVLLNPSPSKGMHDGWETARKTDRPPKIDIDDSGFMKVFNIQKFICLLNALINSPIQLLFLTKSYIFFTH